MLGTDINENGCFGFVGCLSGAMGRGRFDVLLNGGGSVKICVLLSHSWMPEKYFEHFRHLGSSVFVIPITMSSGKKES